MFHSFRDTSPGTKTVNVAGRAGNGFPSLGAARIGGVGYSLPQAPSYSPLGKCL
jgi:hypothetical protein